MGQISILTKEQKGVLDQIRKNEFVRSHFYFTGGTALSEYYLHHRYSEDIDFFSSISYDRNVILQFIEKISEEFHITFKEKRTEIAQTFFLEFSPSLKLKVDFVQWFGQQIKKGINDHGVTVDSFVDIAVNKLTALNDRFTVKDFVDFYFILQHFSLWDLIEGARVKYRMEIEPWILSSDFLGVESFNSLPRMIKPLTLEQLKEFFRELAKKLGKQSVK